MDNDDKDLTETADGENFAEMFEQSFKNQGRFEPGQKMETRILKISNDWVFLDTGRKGEGVLDRKELIDKDGNLTVKEGDTITAWFLSVTNNELRFTTRVGKGQAGNAQLEDAWKAGIPVEGTVEKEVKGGFSVKIAGSVRAFCTQSLMGLRRTENQAEQVGKQLPFKIVEYAENGRNIVVSHRAVLEEEAKEQREALKETLKEGMIVKGKVTSLRDFGAFVSIGAVEGLLPISEVGWGRVTDIREALTVGQELEVAIKQLDWDNNRISFSLKETLANPWDKIVQQFPEGSFHTGKVARLVPFGAFVTLSEGVDGLIHISKLGKGKRLTHPREVIKEGEIIEVKIEAVDRENRRLSLALAEVSRAEEEQASTMTEFRKQTEAAPATMGTLGDLLSKKLEKGKK
jgi:small subunit ribosomal protein S1